MSHDGDEGFGAGALVVVAAVGAAAPEQYGVLAGVGDDPEVAPAVGGAGFEGDGFGAVFEDAAAVADFLQDLAGLQAGALAGERRGLLRAVGAVGELAVEVGQFGGADADAAQGYGEVRRAVVQDGEMQAVLFEPGGEGVRPDALQQAHRRGVARALQGFGEGDAAEVFLVVVVGVVAACERGVVDGGVRVQAVVVECVEGDVGFQGAAG